MSNEKTNVAEFVSELQAGGWTNTSAGSCGDGRLEALCSLSAGRISQRLGQGVRCLVSNGRSCRWLMRNREVKP